MTEQPDATTTIRLNILGELEIIRELDTVVELPSNARAAHLLAMLALQPAYDRQKLVDVFWEGETLQHVDAAEVRRVANKLDQVLIAARKALAIDGTVLASERGVVRWVEDSPCRLTTDLAEFQALARSSEPDDWRAALALVRGEIAENMERDRKLSSPFEVARSLQTEEIKDLLKRLAPDATADTLDNRVKSVLLGRYWQQPSQPASVKRFAKLLPTSRIRRRWRLAGLLTASLVALGMTAWAVWPPASHTASIPPVGSVVDARSGRLVHFVASHNPKPLQEITTLFWICNLSHPQPCYYPNQSPVRSITAHRGDMLEVWIRLYDDAVVPIPLLGVTVVWYPNIANGSLREQQNKQLFRMDIAGFDRPDGHQINEEESVSWASVQMSPSEEFATYAPSYIPGSTVLTSPNHSFQHALPDGILWGENEKNEPRPREHIWLADVGGGRSACTECRSEAVRFIRFRLQIL
jgi:hypothetical protein